MTDERKEMVNQVMEGFDFEKVHELMVQMNWEWSSVWNEDGSQTARVPTFYLLIKHAQELLNVVAEYTDGQNHYIESGGLRAELYDNGDLELSFVAVSSEAWNWAENESEGSPDVPSEAKPRGLVSSDPG